MVPAGGAAESSSGTMPPVFGTAARGFRVALPSNSNEGSQTTATAAAKAPWGWRCKLHFQTPLLGKLACFLTDYTYLSIYCILNSKTLQRIHPSLLWSPLEYITSREEPSATPVPRTVKNVYACQFPSSCPTHSQDPPSSPSACCFLALFTSSLRNSLTYGNLHVQKSTASNL